MTDLIPLSSAPRTAQPLTFLDTAGASLSRATLTALLHRPDAMLAVLEDVDTTPTVSLDAVYVITAHAFQNPMVNVRRVAQVGRFVLVAYTPERLADPDVIITLAHGAAAAAFHQAVVAFQEARVLRYHDSPRVWYQRVMLAARSLVSPLWRLQPAPAEAVFVLNWAAQIAARGSKIYQW